MIIKPFIWFSQYLRFFLNIFGIRRNFDPSGSSNGVFADSADLHAGQTLLLPPILKKGAVAGRSESSNEVKMRSAYLRIFNESWLIFER